MLTNKNLNLLLNYLTESTATSPVTSDKPETKAKRPMFTPDYTVRVVTDVHYLMMKYSAYKAALLATVIERNQNQNKNWQDEIDKVLEKATEDDNVSRRTRLSVFITLKELMFLLYKCMD